MLILWNGSIELLLCHQAGTSHGVYERMLRLLLSSAFFIVPFLVSLFVTVLNFKFIKCKKIQKKVGSWYIFLLLDDLNQRQRNNLTVFFLNRFWFQNKTVKLIWLSKFPKKFGVGGIEWSFSWNVKYLSLCFSLQITACNKFNPKSFLKGCFTSGFEQPKSL